MSSLGKHVVYGIDVANPSFIMIVRITLSKHTPLLNMIIPVKMPSIHEVWSLILGGQGVFLTGVGMIWEWFEMDLGRAWQYVEVKIYWIWLLSFTFLFNFIKCILHPIWSHLYYPKVLTRFTPEQRDCYQEHEIDLKYLPKSHGWVNIETWNIFRPSEKAPRVSSSSREANSKQVRPSFQ